jgi:hypothetical protein
MLLWGYRVPFLSAFPIVLSALLLRAQMPESDEFLAARRPAKAGAEPGAPAAAEGDAASQAGMLPPGPASDGKGALAGGAGAGAAASIPLARLLRRQWRGLLLDTAYVAWLTSVIYVVYAWVPSALRTRKVMAPLTSLGMVRPAAGRGERGGGRQRGWGARGGTGSVPEAAALC